MISVHLGVVGPLIAFAIVFTGSVGVPLPTLAGLILLGGMAGRGTAAGRELALIFAAALAGAVLGDGILFGLGRRHGNRVVAVVCRLSLSPDVCVRQTYNFFARRGPMLFLLARWIPGLSTLSAPFAGASGISLPRFLCFAAAGTAFWVVCGLGLGAMFAGQVAAFLQLARHVGLELGGVVALLMLGYIATAWIRRWLFARKLRMARIEPFELQALLKRAPPPMLVDERSALQREADPVRIPGAVYGDQIGHYLSHSRPPPDTPIVIYCACPNEASAVAAARELRKAGYPDVRPLRGGLDGWRDAGFNVESINHEDTTATRYRTENSVGQERL